MKLLKKLINIQNFLITIFLIILIQKFEFFKNTYLLTQKTINERYQKVAFDFCKNNSSGYIFYIKEKFKLKEKPLIINYNIEPDQNWIFKKDNITKESKDIILLNYLGEISYSFKKHKETGYWISYDMTTPNTTLGANYIKYIGDSSSNNKDYKISFFKKEIAVLNDVESLKFIIDKDLKDYSKLGDINFKLDNNKNLFLLDNNKINFNDHDSVKLIKLDKNFDDSNIGLLDLYLKESIDFSKYKILDNFKNKCMYLVYNND